MKAKIARNLVTALDALIKSGHLTDVEGIQPQVERARDAIHGDYATNLALILGKAQKQKPRELAALLLDALPAEPGISKVEIAGPGFINFFLSHAVVFAVVPEILSLGRDYGRSDLGAGQVVQVEFVSANPTGPLHVGHGRGAAYGACVANLLSAIGFQVQREYYVNDGGRQMNILTVSIWLRYLELCGETFNFPSNGYQGDYVLDIAATLQRESGAAYRHPAKFVFDDIPLDELVGGDKEMHIDALIERVQKLLGVENYQRIFDLGLKIILDDIRDDLEKFGVTYDHWYSERALIGSDTVKRSMNRLRATGHIYEQDGALWFRSTAFGDEKDRVLVRDNGQPTYFASDVAYHVEKFERGFVRVIDIWGADHHGYVSRIKAALQALGHNPSNLDVLLVQFAVLYRGGEKVQMSTRSGEFVTLRQLRKEVGKDAARFFYVMRKADQHLDFDLDLARSQSTDNPVYYIQYAHARICSVLRQATEKNLNVTPTAGDEHLELLIEPHEEELLNQLSRYTEVLEGAALNHEPHRLCHYLRELAHALHTYYNAHPFLVEGDALRDARIKLILAVRWILANGLELLGISAPESM